MIVLMMIPPHLMGLPLMSPTLLVCPPSPASGPLMLLTSRRSLDLSLIQVLALLSMLLDHVAVYLFDSPPDLLRVVGRLAFPLFACMVVVHAFRASDPFALVVRVLLVGLLAQPAVWFLRDSLQLNVCFVLAVGVLAVALYRAGAVWCLLALVGVCLMVSPWLEYGLFGVFLVLSLVGCMVSVWWYPAPLLVWPVLQYVHDPAQVVVSAAAFLLFYFLVRFPFNVPRPPRWFTRWFYPAHLSLIALFLVFD